MINPKISCLSFIEKSLFLPKSVGICWTFLYYNKDEQINSVKALNSLELEQF